VSFLNQYIDPALPVGEEQAAALHEAEVERINRLYNIMLMVQAMPRRLGQEASDEDLLLDKKRAKRVAHVCLQLLKAWGAEAQPVAELGREAAVWNWATWWDEHRIWLVNRERYLATWCYKAGANGDLKWCRSAVTRLLKEQEWLAHAVR
jgi:hypothetical protein